MKNRWQRAAAFTLAAAMVCAQGITVSAEPGETAHTNQISYEGGVKTTGEENGKASLDLTQDARYDAGMSNPDGGVMEIVDYNTVTGWAYAVNGQTGKLTAIALKDMEDGENVDLLDGNDIDVKALVEANCEGFTYGDMTSVAVSADGTKLVVAIQAAGYADNGRVAVFTCNADGTLTFTAAYETGVQPDMVTFTPDDAKILTANEGEPREGYVDGAADPAGTVTVVNVADGSAVNVGFTAYDSAEERQKLTDAGIILKKGADPSADLEPEYIAAGNDTAYVTLQEANAIAVIDLDSAQVTGIYSAGYEDHSKVAVDIDKKDEAYSPKTYESLRGIRMPDSIALYSADGTDYLITANEGDSREWGDYLNESERDFKDGETSPSGKITTENSGLTGKVVFFDSSDYDGLDDGLDYLFGGRSFTVYRADGNGLTEVYDSGSEFEAKTAAYVPENFNCSNDDKTIDDRSGKKGPEVESVTVGTVGEKTYAFVGLERVGGVMVYDITDPEQSSFVNYINSRDFSQDIAGDDSPEGLCFIPAADSVNGSAYLLASCEVSGTVAAYRLTEGTAQEPGGEEPGGQPGGEGPGGQPGGGNPDDTQKPGGSQDPAGGNGGGSNGNSGSGSQVDAGKDAPKTGDQPLTGVYGSAVLLVMAAAGMTGVVIRRKKALK